MSTPEQEPRDAATERAARLAVIIGELEVANRPLVGTMSEERFGAMIARMAEHQLLYEEYQRDNS